MNTVVRGHGQFGFEVSPDKKEDKEKEAGHQGRRWVGEKRYKENIKG